MCKGSAIYPLQALTDEFYRLHTAISKPQFKLSKRKNTGSAKFVYLPLPTTRAHLLMRVSLSTEIGFGTVKQTCHDTQQNVF
jgi:hypothetical protein